VTKDLLEINGHAYGAPMFTQEFCRAIGSAQLTDGAPFLFEGKPDLRYRYFDNLGVAVLETIPKAKVRRVIIFMEVPTRKRRASGSDNDLRPTKTTFCGLLELNGKQLRSPLPSSQFPVKGELTFINRIAFGGSVEAHVVPKSGFIDHVSFDFKRSLI
jgi:hypothetical protein